MGAGPNFGGLPLGLEGEIMSKPLGLIDLLERGAGDTTGPDFKSFAVALGGDIKMGLRTISCNLACEGRRASRVGLAAACLFLASSRADRAGEWRNFCLAASRADRAEGLPTTRLRTMGDLVGTAMSVMSLRRPVDRFSGESRQTTCGPAMVFLGEMPSFLFSESSVCFVILVFGSRVPRARRGTASVSGVVSSEMMSGLAGTTAAAVGPSVSSLSGTRVV